MKAEEQFLQEHRELSAPKLSPSRSGLLRAARSPTRLFLLPPTGRTWGVLRNPPSAGGLCARPAWCCPSAGIPSRCPAPGGRVRLCDPGELVPAPLLLGVGSLIICS